MTRVVFDCAVFVQGLGRRNSVARKCLDLVDAGVVQLCLDGAVLAEIEDVLSRPAITSQFPLIDSKTSGELLRIVKERSLFLNEVEKAFVLPRDRDGEAYTDLAVAAGAAYLVTWNERHLTYLMRQDTPEGLEFCRRFPQIRIVDPPTFVREIERMAREGREI